MRCFEGFQKGVNLGGWISQFAKYDREHFASFITEADIAYIAGLGFDHVRVPVDYNVLEDEAGNVLEEGFDYLRSCFRWCRAHGLNMLIDLHECYGYSFDPLKKDMDRSRFFYDPALQQRFLNLWKRIAREFKDYPDQVAFEPLNEVVLWEVSDAWNQLVREYIRTIRAIAPRAWIVVGGVCYNSVMSVKLLQKPVDDRIVYNFHCYEPMIFTHQGAYWMEQFPSDYRITYPQPLEVYREETRRVLGEEGPVFLPQVTGMGPEFFEIIFKAALDAAEENGAPLYCGEYGVIDLADNPSKIRWLKDIHTAFAKFHIGHALWNYKEKDFGLVDERFAQVKDEFIAVI